MLLSHFIPFDLVRWLENYGQVPKRNTQMAGTCGDHGMNSIHSFKRIYTNPTFLATCSQIKTPSSEPIDILPGETVCYLQKHDMRYKLSSPPGGLLPKTSSPKAVFGSHRSLGWFWMKIQVQLVQSDPTIPYRKDSSLVTTAKVWLDILGLFL